MSKLGYERIVFMGLDGTGKSTQAERLANVLAAEGRRVYTIHHASSKVPGLSAVKRRSHGRAVRALKALGAHVHWDENARPPTMFGRLVTVPFVAWLLLGSLLKSWWYAHRKRGEVVIYDRCFLDDAVKVRWRFDQGEGLSRFLLKWAPRPDVVLLLVDDPQVTYERKKAKNCSFKEYLGKADVMDRVIKEAEGSGWRIITLDMRQQSIEQIGELVEGTVIQAGADRERRDTVI